LGRLYGRPWRGALFIAIADESVIAALVRGPNFDTLLKLWVTARIDIRNGSIFDLEARRPKVRTSIS
jgi:cyclopropane-fatty-acyl-phospholipid synthase